MFDFLIIGGDERQVCLKNILASQGYTVCGRLLCEELYDTEIKKTAIVREVLKAMTVKEKILDDICKAEAILAPIPFASKENVLNHKIGGVDITLDEIYESMVNGQHLFAGCIPKWFETKCTKKGCICFDYMEDEAIAVSNAVATAEGIIAEAVMKYKGNIHGTKCLILGFGRCGKVLAGKLKGMSAQVCICVRKPSDEAWAESLGYEAVNINELENVIEDYPVLFNTVPKCVLDREMLSNLRKDAMIFDIASNPGGVDYDAAKRMEIDAELYPSLPGKYSPKASAEILARAIKRKID